MHPRTCYEHANDSPIAWDCILCNYPNYSIVCFSEVFSNTNKFSILSENSYSAQDLQIHNAYNVYIHMYFYSRKETQKSKRKQTKNAKILNINFQSIKSKQDELENLISSVKQDIIFGTETWIDSTIKDIQIFPDGYHMVRNDRKLSGGGVLIAVRDTLLTTAVPELHTLYEIVWCKLEIVGQRTVYLSTFYNPKTSNEEGFHE